MRPAPILEQLPRAARDHLARGPTELIHIYQAATWRTVLASGDVLYLKAAPAGCYRA